MADSSDKFTGCGISPTGFFRKSARKMSSPPDRLKGPISQELDRAPAIKHKRCIKFDGSLVMGMLSNNASRQAVSALQQMAHGLGLKTVAECVENDAVFERVRAMGIDYAQGFDIHRPLPLDQLLALEIHHFAE